MPLTISRKTPSRKSTLQTASIGSSPLAEGPNAQQKPASTAASPPRTRQPLQRAVTDTVSQTLTRKPSDSSIYSTASKAEKKRSAWRGVAKTLPSLLKSSRGASSTSLVSQDAEPPIPNEAVDAVKSSPSAVSKIPVRRTTISPKASTLVEPQNASPTPKSRDSDERTSADFSDGSATMVDEVQPNGRALSEELSATRQQLAEATNECSALREHIRTLEGSNNAQLRQSVEEAVNHTKGELMRAHTAELEKQRETVRSLHKRNEELASRVMIAEDGKADATRAHDAEMQSLQFRMKNLQQSLESIQHEMKMKDEHKIVLERENGELRGRVVHLEENERALAEGGAEAQKRLLEDVNNYRSQLEISQRALDERDAQLTQLQVSKLEAENMLISAQGAVDEKEMIIGDLQRRLSGIEERNASLEDRIVEMERELVETKSSAERTLQMKADDYEHQLTDAHRVAETLRAELTSSSATIQQLRTALDTSRADAQISATTIEDQAAQLRQARKQLAMLEDSARALEDEKEALESEKAELIRNHATQVEAERRTVHNLRKSMESTQRESSSKQERTSVLVAANEELRREVIGLKEQLGRDREEAQKTRKELAVAKAALSSLEEKNQTVTETTKEKEKLVDEVAQLQRQLEDASNQLNQQKASPQAQAGGEEKLKGDLQTALATVEEQKAVIARLQQSIGERSREEPQPRLPPSLTRIAPTQRSTTQRSRSSTVSVSEPPKPSSSSSSPKPPTRTPPSRNSTMPPSSSPAITSSTPLKKSSTSPSRQSTLIKASNDQDRAFQASSTDSESDGGHSAGSSGAAQRQANGQSTSTDVKRLRPPTESGLVYRMGHTVFGSLWRRIWG